VISNVYAGIDQVTIEGALNLKAQYLTENGVGTYSKTTDFKQELACIGALPGDMVSASAEVVSLTTNIESGDAPSLVTATNIRAVVNNYKQVSVSLPTDMFSISKELNLTNNCVEVSTFAGYKVFTDTSLGSSNIEGGGVDEVMCAINPQIAISRIVIDGGKIITEGVLSCDLIYRNNEAESVLADKISQPFISKIDTDTNGEISLDSATCEVANIKIHSAKEVEILYNISLGATILEDKYIQYVAEVEEASDKAENPSAITIYVTKPNETLFEVARTLSVDPQTITEQNDLAGDIFTGGQRVFVYKPLVAEF
jgi:hypothetical protein